MEFLWLKINTKWNNDFFQQFGQRLQVPGQQSLPESSASTDVIYTSFIQSLFLIALDVTVAILEDC